MVRVTRLLAAACLSSIAASPLGAAPDPALVERTVAQLAAPNSPGCSIAIARDGREDWSHAFGLADLEGGRAITADTIFEAGSVSKQFTAAAVLLLAEQGKLSLGDDIRKYLPEMPAYARPITIDHLLSHTSGLRDWGDVAGIGGWPRSSRIYSNDLALLIAARQRRLNYLPGDAYSYTNSGYNMAAIIVQRVSGLTLADFTKRYLFDPLGMHSTSWRDDFTRVVPGRARAYEPRGEAFAEAMPFENDYGNGGLLTTPRDLLAWNRALATNRVGRDVARRLAEVATLTSGKKITYARGQVRSPIGSTEMIHHSGITGGYTAWLARIPGNATDLAILCNRADAPVQRIGEALLSAYLPPMVAQSNALIAQSPARAGVFRNRLNGLLVRLTADNGLLRYEGGPALVARSADELRVGSNRVVFSGNDRFSVTGGDGQTIVHDRVTLRSPTAAQLAGLQGDYASDEADATYRVLLDNGALVAFPLERPSERLALRPITPTLFAFDGGSMSFASGAGRAPATMTIGTSRVWAILFNRRR